MKSCSDATVDITDVNPSGYGFCGNNEKFRCFRPFAGSQPDSPGVCLPASLVDQLAKNEITLSIPFLMKIFQVIQMDFSSDELDKAVEVIKEEFDESDELLNRVDVKVDQILEKVNSSRRRLGKDANDETNAAQNSAGKLQANKEAQQKEEAFTDIIDSFLNGDKKEEVLKAARDAGVPENIVSTYRTFAGGLELPHSYPTCTLAGRRIDQPAPQVRQGPQDGIGSRLYPRRDAYAP